MRCCAEPYTIPMVCDGIRWYAMVCYLRHFALLGTSYDDGRKRQSHAILIPCHTHTMPYSYHALYYAIHCTMPCTVTVLYHALCYAMHCIIPCTVLCHALCHSMHVTVMYRWKGIHRCYRGWRHRVQHTIYHECIIQCMMPCTARPFALHCII